MKVHAVLKGPLVVEVEFNGFEVKLAEGADEKVRLFKKNKAGRWYCFMVCSADQAKTLSYALNFGVGSIGRRLRKVAAR